MDVVLPLKQGAHDYKELRYALRSLKNLSVDNLIIVGAKPDWVTNVIEVRTEQLPDKHDDITNKLLIIANDPQISERFIMMNDDFYIMKKFRRIPYYHTPAIKDLRSNALRNSRERWKNIKYDTYKWLRAHGSTWHDYELHVPIELEKSKLKEVALIRKNNPNLLCYRSLYGNLWQVGGRIMRDCKVSFNGEFINTDLPFLSSSDRMADVPRFANTLERSFPQKSKYEI